MDDNDNKHLNVVSITSGKTINADWKAIINEYHAGTEIKMIAAKHGLSPMTIFRRLRNLGISTPTRQAIAARAEEKRWRANAKRAKTIINQKNDAIKEATIGQVPASSDDFDDAEMIEATADALNKVTAKHRFLLAKNRKAVATMLNRFVAAGCTKVVETKTGMQVVVSPSDEIKNLSNCLKIIIPLERQAWGLDTLEDTEKDKAAKRAAAQAQAAQKQTEELLEEMRNAFSMASVGKRG